LVKKQRPCRRRPGKRRATGRLRLIHKRSFSIWGTLALFLSLDGVYESLP